MKTLLIPGCLFGCMLSFAGDLPYPIVDTGQNKSYDARNEMDPPAEGQPFFGQDASYAGSQPQYRSNRDDTVRDEVTGLLWIRKPLARKTYAEAVQGAASCRVGGYADWRLPSIKELYSLIHCNGTDPHPGSLSGKGNIPFIDTRFFEFTYGDPAKGERIIDAQYVSATRYVSTTMGGNLTVFGVNFADGRIKGYPIQSPRGEKTFFVLYVRGNPAYGKNDFVDNGDGTVTDRATGLTWMQTDSGKGMAWPAALVYAEALTFAGQSDWRLPNAKELQSIVDYERSPDHTGTPAIDPVFQTTGILNEDGEPDFPSYWTGTSHVRGRGADAAVYICFGRGLGFMSSRPGPPGRQSGNRVLMDVHGAGNQRSDPKTGDAGRFPQGRGPQGDVIRIQNFVRCVRGGVAEMPSQ